MQPIPIKKLPPKAYRRVIEEFSVIFSDPVYKFKFLQRAVEEVQRIPAVYKIYPPLAEVVLRKKIMEKAEGICPGSLQKAKTLIRQGVISSPQANLWQLYRFRHVIVSVAALCFIWGIGTAVASLFETYHAVHPPKFNESALERRSTVTSRSYPVPRLVPLARIERKIAPLNKIYLPAAHHDKRITTLAPLHLPLERNLLSIRPLAELPLAAGALQTAKRFPRYLEDPIWLVEKSGSVEIYSNRLHIITDFTAKNIPRRYHRFSKKSIRLPSEARTTSEIAGILYHASESDLFPFTPDMNTSIKEHSRRLIRYVRKKRLYHYLIDRFGRVYRIVPDRQAAFHAGNSVWADEAAIYLNLNHAFIGVCFEGRGFETAPDGKAAETTLITAMPSSSINEAQLQSGKELTDWLRVKYKIPQENCVPHGLTSVNPKNMLIGYHLDMSHGFPFEQFGLSNKYEEPLPSITEFGFTYDRYFKKIFRGNLWPGIRLSEAKLRREARRYNISLKKYRTLKGKRFADLYEWQKVQLEKPEQDGQMRAGHTKTASGG